MATKRGAPPPPPEPEAATTEDYNDPAYNPWADPAADAEVLAALQAPNQEETVPAIEDGEEQPNVVSLISGHTTTDEYKQQVLESGPAVLPEVDEPVGATPEELDEGPETAPAGVGGLYDISSHALGLLGRALNLLHPAERMAPEVAPSPWTSDIQDALLAPFPEDEIEFLPRAATNNRALALAHIDARSVMRRLDAVVGPGGWSFDYDVLAPDCKKLKGKLTVLGVTKCDAGEASTEDEPLKSAVSDCLKRCGVHFGIARYLYYLPQLWVNYDPSKRRFTDTPRLPDGAVKKALEICGYQGTFPGPVGRSEPTVNTTPVPLEYGPPTDSQEAPSNGNGEDTAPPAPRPARPPASSPGKAPMVCSIDGCEKPLTKGQHDISLRAFNQALCPQHQREMAGHAGESPRQPSPAPATAPTATNEPLPSGQLETQGKIDSEGIRTVAALVTHCGGGKNAVRSTLWGLTGVRQLPDLPASVGMNGKNMDIVGLVRWIIERTPGAELTDNS